MTRTIKFQNSGVQLIRVIRLGILSECSGFRLELDMPTLPFYALVEDLRYLSICSIYLD